MLVDLGQHGPINLGRFFRSGVGKLSCKRPHSKCFQLVGQAGLCCNLANFTFCKKAATDKTSKCMGVTVSSQNFIGGCRNLNFMKILRVKL